MSNADRDLSAKDLIAVVIKEVYGKPMAYPANYRAEVFAAVAGVKTLNSRLIELARDLGFRVEEVWGKPLRGLS
jgi:hypothetical protein